MRNRHSRTFKLLAATAAFMALSTGSAVAAPLTPAPAAGVWAPVDAFSCKAHPGLAWCGVL